MRVVVADDSIVQRDIAVGALRKLGHEVVAAVENGQKAWDAIQQLHPDMAVLDFVMPYLTGGEVVQRIRAANLPLKVFYATSMGQKSVAYNPEWPADGVIIKPYTLPMIKIELMKAGIA